MMSNKERTRGRGLHSSAPVHGLQQPEKRKDGEAVAFKNFSSLSSPTIMIPTRSTSSTNTNSTRNLGQKAREGANSPGGQSEDLMMPSQPRQPRVSAFSRDPVRLHISNIPFRFR